MAWLHLGHLPTTTGVCASCERRLRLRAFAVFRCWTAMVRLDFPLNLQNEKRLNPLRVETQTGYFTGALNDRQANAYQEVGSTWVKESNRQSEIR